MGKKTTRSSAPASAPDISEKVALRMAQAAALKKEQDQKQLSNTFLEMPEPYPEELLPDQLESFDAVIGAPEALAAFPPGWLLNVGCRNPTPYPIKSFSAQWIVPHPPEANGQLFFIFIGIMNTTSLVQCIMQWGQTPCGGDQSWTIGCMQVVNGHATCKSPNIPVVPGQLIFASITLLPATPYTYRLQINNVTMTCAPLAAPRDCCVVLEAYTIQSNAEFPPDNYTLVDKISIATTTGAMPVNWSNQSKPNSGGQHVAIPNNDQIALWYHGLPNNPNDLLA